MREVKFRAWHEENESMVYFDPKVLLNDQIQAQHLSMLMCGHYGDVLMQFTGVRDMDGRDIYDGDIISDPEKMYVYRISHNAPLAGYIMTRLWSNSLRDIQRLEAANMEINHMAIIGNIHEDTAK